MCLLGSPSKHKDVIDEISGHELTSSIGSNKKFVARIDNMALTFALGFGLSNGIGTGYDISHVTEGPDVTSLELLMPLEFCL